MIIYSGNGGKNWHKEETGTHVTLRDVSFSDLNTGTIVGDYGTILRTTTGGATWVEDKPSLPEQITLVQNYPNPFTANTTIPFELSKPEHVSLRVYNSFGREVAVLLDERKEPGSHSPCWNASGLPGGVYFYMLRIGNISRTGKMLHAGDSR